jgi:hypothetical protein
MKTTLLAVAALACAFTFSMGTSAQESGAKEMKVHSMTGCLKAGSAPGSYELTDVTKGPKTVGIVSSDANLAPHVGHKIEITGTAVPAKEAMDENKDVPKAPHYMKVTSIKMLSKTCP